MTQITDSNAIVKVIDEVIINNPRPSEQYRAGKKALFGFFVGQTMKATQGKANPALRIGGDSRRWPPTAP